MELSELEMDTSSEEDRREVNFYGSFVGEESDSSLSSNASEGESEGEVSSDRVVCSCKNTCSRKRSAKAPGCPCKNSNLTCCEKCKCGTKKHTCKNKPHSNPEEVRISATPLENTTPNREVCSCKNTCSRKATLKSAGCPCKTANLGCCDECKCGTKKSQCKNRSVDQVVNRNPSAFARHQEQVEKAEIEIKEFIKGLTAEDKDTLLVRLLTQGRGSLEFARDMLCESNQPDPSEAGPLDLGPPDPGNGPNAQPEWCVCGVCRVMPLDVENKCCGKRTCVTCYEMFHNICIDREVLTLAIRARFDIMAEEADYSSNSFRKASYRQYCLWKYGKLGRGNRRVLPSCVVIMIRRAYPAADGVYMGYKSS